MAQFVQQVINGLSLGSIYALIALGYTMIYGIMNLINFAHCDILMIGAYVGLFGSSMGLGFIPSTLMAVVVCAILGVVIEKVAYRPLRNAERITLLITAIGVSFLLEYTMMYFFGANVRNYPAGFFGFGTFKFHGIILSSDKLLAAAITVVLMVILQFVIKKTKLGKAIRAASSDQDAAQLMGISVDKSISLTFLIGSALAAVAGVMYGAMFTANPLMGMQPGIKAFVAAVFGGIGSIPGAITGGVLLGFIETMVGGYISSAYKDAAAFVILIIILIVKPTGLLGKKTNEKV